MMPYDMTLIQYANHMRDEFFTDPDNAAACTRKRYAEFYPPEGRLTLWASCVASAAAQGITLRRQVLDDLYRHAPSVLREILHCYMDTALPAGYLIPSARQANRQGANHG